MTDQENPKTAAVNGEQLSHASIFNWRSKPSAFANNPAFTGHYSGISARASAQQDKTPFVPLGSINTDAVKPADKTAMIRRGALSEQRRAV